ncbi:MAG: ATP-binding cassette domain-containing protein [Gammaproteobacteria bacterium]|nr:ATP-binding cassette domain-containing protein [Gammaproteobacteria bacterium]
MRNDIYVSVNQVSCYYGAHCAVDNLSFEVKRGEVLGFLGPNGAGKSTTMAMITGNLAPSAGQILVNGIDILDKPKEAKANIGFLPEQPPLYRDLTVDEYLRFCAKLNRVGKAKINTAVDAAKQRCGLTEVGKRLIDNLSKGYQQRVGIAQAIVHSPAVVILDEPTVGLDPIQIREIRRLVRELGGEHSVILSTHILPEIQVTCDRVQIINKGKLVLSDTVAGIEQYMGASSLVIALKNAPVVTALESIPLVNAVASLGDGRFRLVYEPESDPAEQIVQTAVNNNWGLHEIFPEKRSLEQIFVDITTSEADNKSGVNVEHSRDTEGAVA